jgi:sugar phosphate permease
LIAHLLFAILPPCPYGEIKRFLLKTRDNSDSETPSSYRWTILVLCWFIYFSFGLTSTTLSAIAPLVRSDLNLSYSQMGFILGTWQLVYTVAAFPLGFLIDRIGAYKSLLLAASIVSISAILRSFASSFETMTVFVAIFGFGGCIVSIGIPKIAATWFSGKERATATGIYATGGTTGGITALLLTNSVVIPLVGSWRTAYLIYGLAGLLIAAVWLLRGRASPGNSDHKSLNRSVPRIGWLEVKQSFSKNVLLIIFIGITTFLVAHGLQQWLPTILQLNGMTMIEAGYAVSLVNVFMIFGSLLAPRIPYWLGSRKAAICLLLVIQGLSVLTISGVSGPYLWTVLALRGISGGFMPLLSLILMDLPEVGSTRMGMVGGLFFAIGEIGGFGGPASMGLFKDLTGTFLWGLVFLAVVCEAMIIPTLFLKVDKKAKTAAV